MLKANSAQDEIKLNESRLQALLVLNQMYDASLKEIANYAQDAAIKLTNSKIGYLAFTNDEETILTMYSWSKRAMAECDIPNKKFDYVVNETGLWGEAIRQRHWVITNDYSANSPYKKGLPVGHVKLERHLNIPVFDGDKIVAVAGVANKETNYDEKDVRQLTLLMDGMWKMIQRKRSHEELAHRNQQSELLNAVADIISTKIESSEILQDLKELFENELELDKGCIYIYNDLDDTLQLSIAWGKISNSVIMNNFPTSAVNWEAVVRTKEAHSLLVDSDVCVLLSSLETTNWRGTLYLPLLLEGEIEGVCELSLDSNLLWTPERLHFFKILTNQLVMAIQKSKLYEKLYENNKRLKMLSRSFVEIQETQKRQLARELHDEFGSILTALSILLQHPIDSSTENISKNLNDARELVSGLMVKVRELSLDLHPSMLDDFGLIPALTSYFQRYSNQTKIHIDFKNTLGEKRVPQYIETAAFRIIQESLTNIARYAKIDFAQVRIWFDGDILGLSIEDRGEGFDVEEIINTGKSFGLKNMQERAELLGGFLGVDSRLGLGTTINAMLPVSKDSVNNAYNEVNNNEVKSND